ncbi:hypothetical protein M5689_015670 [Euphorbia peplus]|nr:hypothetical protein M5689_015670 [Euphorbia peplus]
MASQKPLHQLLQEDQEPFLLTNYIADRKFQLTKTAPARRNNLQMKKLRSPVTVSHNFCFFSINNNSPDVKSPIFEFKSPAKSPCNKTQNSSSIFLHVPAKTASLLLEAAVRIQKKKQKGKDGKGNNGFGLFGSLIKRMTHRKKREIRGGDAVEEGVGCCRTMEDERMKFECELETSISSQSDREDEEEVAGVSDFGSFDEHFCDSPFHLVLRRSPSSGHRTPVFSSPPTSPIKGKEQYEVEKDEDEEEEEEEEKEQNSPVSVLDPPFEDDDDAHDHHSQDDGFDDHLDYSYAFVLRAKQQLLQKLRRFEKLAELDPIELEKRMLEQEHEDEHDDDFTEDEEEQEQDIHDMIMEQLGETSFGRTRKMPPDMKRLVSDLITEEEGEQSYITDRELMAKRVCKRLEGWNCKEVECNTIDMMVEKDFKKQIDEWKKYQEQVGEAALEIEVSIFKVLVEELSEDLVDSISSD